MNIDNLLIGRLVKVIRGDRSQGQLNQKFKFKSNTIAKWESGTSRITWHDFIRLAHLCKIDIVKITQNYFHYYSDIGDQSQFMAFIIGKQTLANVSRLSGVSHMKINRILKGTAPFYLVDFFKILNGLSHLVTQSYISQFINLKLIVDETDQITYRVGLIQFTYDYPEAASIITALTLPRFKDAGRTLINKLSAETGIELKRLDFLIEKMIELNFIEWKKNKLVLTGIAHADDRGSVEGTMRVRKFWLDRALEITGHQDQLNVDERDVFGSVVFASNKEARQKIISLYLRFFEDMKNVILEHESKSDMIQVLSFQLFNPKHLLQE